MSMSIFKLFAPKQSRYIFSSRLLEWLLCRSFRAVAFVFSQRLKLPWDENALLHNKLSFSFLTFLTTKCVLCWFWKIEQNGSIFILVHTWKWCWNSILIFFNVDVEILIKNWNLQQNQYFDQFQPFLWTYAAV